MNQGTSLKFAFLLLVASCAFACGSSNGGRVVPDMCEQNDQCGEGLVCSAMTCQEPGSVGRGGPCSATRDCQVDLFCSPAGICAPSGPGDVGDSCLTGAECMKGLTCQVFGFGGTCAAAGDVDLGGACSENLDCIAGLVCNAAGACENPLTAYPPFEGVECADDEADFRGYYQVPRGAPLEDFYRHPFPSDALVADDGTIDLSGFPRPGQNFLGVDLVDLYVDALQADFTGFASQGAVAWRFSRELDFDSVSSAPPVFVDITDPQSTSTRAVSYGYNQGRRLYHCQHRFSVRPVLLAGQNILGTDVLEPGHTYAVYLTTAIQGAGGVPVTVDPDLSAVLGAAEPGDSDLARVWNQEGYEKFREYLADGGTPAATDIAIATVFTVQETTERMEALATAVAGEAGPVLSDLTVCDTGVASPCEDGERGVCSAADPDFTEIHGKFTVPVYQEGTAPYVFEGGAIAVNGAGVPQLQRTEEVCFALTIPTSGAGPFPFTVYAHGTGGSYTGVVGNGVAKSLAQAGVATFSYDGVVHGARRNGVDRDPDDLMFNVLNPQSARDNNAQGAVDVLQALRIPAAVGNIVVGSINAALDPAKVFYFGHSQGSNVGIPAVAVSDAVPGAVFSGAGGYLTDGILKKTSPVDSKAGLELLVGEELDTAHPIMVVWQTYFERVDPANYGRLLIDRPPDGIAAKNVFMTWGPDDTFAPVPTLDAMANSARLQPVSPGIAPGDHFIASPVSRPISGNVTGAGILNNETVTAFVSQYTADDFDGHFVAQRNSNAVADWVAFITSMVSSPTNAATVP